MERKFEAELEELKQSLLSLGTKVERNIGDAIEALITCDPVLAQDVISRDPLIDIAEIQVDELCLFLLARRQPVAKDLRFITTALKIVKDLERVGDMAADISEHVLSLLGPNRVPSFPEVQEMARLAQNMLKRSLDAFVNRDPVLAREVIADDDQVDRIHRYIWDQLVSFMSEDQGCIAVGVHLFSMVKFLERVGDHSCNVAEMVVFMVEGKDIRHLEKDRASREKLAAEQG